MTRKIRNEVMRFIIVTSFTTLSFSFMISIYTLFLLSRGLNLFQISFLGFVYSLICVVLQLPTGALADVWGRKNTYILSKVFLLISFIVYVKSHNFSGYLLGETLWAIANALESGCMSAHIWETIAQTCAREGVCTLETEKINKKASSLMGFTSGMMGALGGFVGANLAQKNMALPWIVSAIFVFISIIVDIFLVQEDKKNNISMSKDLKNMITKTKEATKITFKNSKLLELFVISFFMRMAVTSVYNFWQVKGKELNGTNIAIFGSIWVLIELFCSLGSLIGERLNRFIDEKKLLVATIFISAFGIVLMAITRNFVTFIAAFLVLELVITVREYVFGISEQKVIDEISKNDSESMRATILSLFSMSSQIGISIGLLGAGKIGDKYSVNVIWYISAVICLLLSVVIFVSLFKKEAKRKESLVTA